jgi:EpsI family protein
MGKIKGTGSLGIGTLPKEPVPLIFPSPAWPRLALLAGVLALYVPTFASLAGGAWREDEYAHGPLILAVAVALAWRERARLRELAGGAAAPGTALVLVGVLFWLLGRTQGLVPVEAGSLLLVATGVALLAWGRPGLRILAFPLAFLVFYVPLPGFVLETATAPLKELVSSAVAGLLAAFGYAVERAGVVLAVEGREMLVADACSGLNSIVSLFALALLYAHLRGASRGRTLLLVAAIVPIAVAANILRVLALVLVTVHAGPDAAQGFVHEALGLSVFVVALLMLIGLDRLGRTASPASHASPVPSRLPRRQDREGRGAGGGRVTPWIVAAGMVSAAVAAPALKPVADPNAAFDLEAALPASFAGWRIDPTVVPVSPAPDVQENLDRLYRQVVARTYVNGAGERMMLTVAHGGDQSDALKAHRQEVCYRAQGFSIHGVDRGALEASGRDIAVTRFLAVRGERSEPVTYWFTMGERVVLGRLERLRVQLAHGLQGRVPDGLLVRVSSIDPDPARAHAAQAAFVGDLAAAVPSQYAARLVGAARS